MRENRTCSKCGQPLPPDNRMPGADLKRRREKLGMTQVQLAEKIGVHSNTVARWEREEIIRPKYLPGKLEEIEAAK